MFGRKQSKENPEVALPRLSITGAFGKLPSEADFVQIDSNWRELKDLDDTLQNVYSELSRANQLDHFAGCGVLRTGGGDRQATVNLVYPSEDKSGRFYPFVLFHRLSEKGFYYKPDAQFAASLPAMTLAIGEPELAQLPGLPSPNWLTSLRQQPEYCTPMDPRLAKRAAMTMAEKVTLGHWLDVLVGQDPALRQDIIVGTILLLRQLKQGRIHRAYYGIWLPLPAGEHGVNCIAFWLQLLTAVMTDQRWRPDIVWSTMPDNNRLFILTKPLTSSALQATASATTSVTSFLGWNDVLPAEPNTELRQPVKQWISNEQASLLDIAIEWYQLL